MLACTRFSFAQQNPILNLTKIQQAYDKGDYKVGFKLNQQMLKEYESNPEVHIKALYLAARGSDLLGNFSDYEYYLKQASELKGREALFKKYPDINVYAYDAYASYQFDKQATLYIDQAIAHYQKDSLTLYDLKTKKLELLIRRGLFVDASPLLQDVITYRKNRLGKFELVFNAKKNKTQKVKIKKEERVKRAREYAFLRDVEAQLFFEQGDYDTSALLIGYNKKWIEKHIGKRDIAYVHNLTLLGDLFFKKENYDKAIKYYNSADGAIRSTKYLRYKSTSREALLLKEKLAIAYSFSDQSTKYTKHKAILEKRIKPYYGKDSYYYLRTELLSVHRNIYNENWEKAESKLSEALRNAKVLPINHLFRAELNELLMTIYLEQNHFNKAQNAIEQDVKIKAELWGVESPRMQLANMQLASFYVEHTEEFSNADSIYSNGLQSMVAKNFSRKNEQYVYFVEREVMLYQILEQYKKALSVSESLLKDTKKYFGENSKQYALAMATYADVLVDVGRYTEAELNLNASIFFIEERSSDKENENLVYAYETMGRLQILLNDFEAAEKFLNKSYKISKRTKNEDRLAIAIEERAMLDIHTGQYNEIESNLFKVIRSKEKRFGTDSRFLLKPIQYLAYLYYEIGDYSLSEKELSRALKICKKSYGENSVKYADLLMIQASIYQAMGDNDRAYQLENRILEIQKHNLGEEHIALALTINQLALLKSYTNSDSIEILFNQSLKMIDNTLGSKNLLYAEVLKNKAIYHLNIHNTSEAKRDINAAYLIWHEKFGDNNKHIADYYYIKGCIDVEDKNFLNANNEFVSAKNIYQYVFSEEHPNFIKALGKSAQMQYILEDTKLAVEFSTQTVEAYVKYIENQFPSLSEREKTKTWNTMKSDFEFHYFLAMQFKTEYPELLGSVLNISMATKALMLSSSVKLKHRLLNSGDTSLVHAYQTWVNKREELSQLYAHHNTDKKNDNQIKNLEGDIEQLEKSLSEKSELFASNYEKKKVDWKSLRKQLSNDQVAVDIIRYRTYKEGFTTDVSYAALAITNDSKEIVAVELKQGNDLEKKYLKYYRNCIKYHIEDEYSYAEFWKPIEQILQKRSNVLLAPEGVYCQINLETIPLEKNKYVLNETEITLVSNLKDLLMDKYASKNLLVKKNDAVLIGNPIYYKDRQDYHKINQLPGAEDEVNELAKLLTKNNWKVQKALEEDVYESSVKEVESPRVFHIATHGFFLEDVKQNNLVMNEDVQVNPLLRSGLLLEHGGDLLGTDNVLEFNTEEGILTAYEAMNLNFDNTELVVLSACETGVGDIMIGEGVYGLQRSFMVAGAHNVMMSLFKVSDEFTQELMVNFYTNWLKGMGKREAFLKAKKDMQQKNVSPINWGAFVLIGL